MENGSSETVDVARAEKSGSRTRSRYAYAAVLFLLFLSAWTVLRVLLFLRFHAEGSNLADIFRMGLTGLYRDCLAGAVFLLPILAWYCIPQRWFGARWHRRVFTGALFVGCFVYIFILATEFFFFSEFQSRFNTVAVDYLIYPEEVLRNIWQSYAVIPVVLVCLGLAGAFVFATRKVFDGLFTVAFALRFRMAALAGTAALAALLACTMDLRQAKVASDRTLNELANNGAISFVVAAWTRNLDYAAFYKTMPLPEAYARARRLLASPKAEFTTAGESIERRISGDPGKPRLNVVIILEESLGSEFWGCLGRKESLTPNMDQLALSEGILFTNIYACGNRTVRGMEGVLSSFPPLPGDSIVKRDRSDNVETLARVLKRDGYSTLFVYGGRGIFDGMRSYAVRNGYDRFVEQKHIPKPIFTTAWGVCDEDLFGRSIEELRALSAEGKPFFATLLTTSNHRPYTYPTGRIPEDPAKKWRRNAVKYSDYSLGKFFEAAKREAFWTNTIFVVVADHGARVYGKQSIPIKSYEIPLVILGPAVVKAPMRVPVLGSSLDVGPTVLGLIGRPYTSLFFGRDLLAEGADERLALLNHNRDIGLLSGNCLTVLRLMEETEFYEGDPKQPQTLALVKEGRAEQELEKDAMALYEVADHLYMHHLYHLDTPASSPKPVRQAAQVTQISRGQTTSR